MESVDYCNGPLHLPKSIVLCLYSWGGGNDFGCPILMMAWHVTFIKPLWNWSGDDDKFTLDMLTYKPLCNFSVRS